MNADTFNDFADLALRKTGQFIPSHKSYLIEARLGPIARREGFGSMDELAHCVRARPNPALEAEIAAALLSKQTRFFREKERLTRIVSDILPSRLKASSNGRARVLCAGGGPGQEVYSLAMLIANEAPAALNGARIDLLSIDVCKQATERGRQGDFGHFEVQRGLSIHQLLRHFERQETGDWRISAELRAKVSFRQNNILEDIAGLGMFDVILCSDVLTGMAREVRGPAVDALAAQLAPGGVLLLSGGEVLPDTSVKLEASNVFRGTCVEAGTAERAAA
ncbi:MAG: CheR family methyltransferase [Pseudomonadota bacterium]